jgi:tRNA(adenine34) deaminase
MNHESFMKKALEQAKLAEAAGEVPVGAVLVLNNEIIAAGYNQNINLSDPSAHAEMVVLREAGKKIANHRLLNTKLYVTLEPCLMCVGVMVHARVSEVIFGATDPKTGACGSCVGAHEFSFHNHQLHVVGGVLADECGTLLKNFFKARRV